MTRIIGRTGSRRRTSSLLVAIFSTVALLGLVVVPAQAALDKSLFELDRDAKGDTTTTFFGVLNAAVASGSAGSITIQVCQATAASAVGHTLLIDAERFSVTATANASGGGCASNATFKRNLTVNRAGGSATARATSTCSSGADRFATNGSKDAGFWFFHDAVGPVDRVGQADGTFDGGHTAPSPGGNGVFCNGTGPAPVATNPNCSPRDADDVGGDILILTTCPGGGAVTTVRVFEWIGPAGSDASAGQPGHAGHLRCGVLGLDPQPAETRPV